MSLTTHHNVYLNILGCILYFCTYVFVFKESRTAWAREFGLLAACGYFCVCSSPHKQLINERKRQKHKSTISGNKTLGLSVVGTHMIHFSHSNTTQEGASMRGLQASHTLVKPLFLVHSFDYLVRPFKQSPFRTTQCCICFYFCSCPVLEWVSNSGTSNRELWPIHFPPDISLILLLIEGKFYCNVHVQETVRKQTGARLLAQVFFWIFPSPIQFITPHDE